MRRALPALALLAGLLGRPAESAGQILDRIRRGIEAAGEVAGETADTAERLGPAVLPITVEQERTIGSGVAATVAGMYGVVRDPALTRYVNLVGAAVADAAPPRPGIAYRFAVLDTDELNAFAAPGGWIFVTRGALAVMEDEATLAGVLAHEIGHVDDRDVIDEIRDKARTRLGIEEAGERIDPGTAAYFDLAVEIGSGALFMGLSRGDEMAADAFAVRATAAAGYDPAGLGRFVAAIEDAHGDERVSLLAATHPDPEDRLEALEAAVRALPRGDRTGVVAAERFAAATRAVRPAR